MMRHSSSLDQLGRVDIMTFFNYVMKKSWLQQTHIGLSLYDASGEGYLREPDMETYIIELIPSLCQLQRIDQTFLDFYTCTVMRKFFFFLDPLRCGRVRIVDILSSGFLDSMLELRESGTNEAQLARNWFSHQSALRVYGLYIQLDQDRNGLLSRVELARYGNGTLTDAFLNRVFEECITYEGDMDYKTFLDFVLAMEHKTEPQAITYLFRFLDIGGQGKLYSPTVQFFYTDICRKLSESGGPPPNFTDVLNEIFDMIAPANPDYITLDDLLKSNKGPTFISMLIDVQGFLIYENREASFVDLPEEAEL